MSIDPQLKIKLFWPLKASWEWTGVNSTWLADVTFISAISNINFTRTLDVHHVISQLTEFSTYWSEIWSEICCVSGLCGSSACCLFFPLLYLIHLVCVWWTTSRSGAPNRSPWWWSPSSTIWSPWWYSRGRRSQVTLCCTHTHTHTQWPADSTTFITWEEHPSVHHITMETLPTVSQWIHPTCSTDARRHCVDTRQRVSGRVSWRGDAAQDALTLLCDLWSRDSVVQSGWLMLCLYLVITSTEPTPNESGTLYTLYISQSLFWQQQNLFRTLLSPDFIVLWAHGGNINLWVLSTFTHSIWILVLKCPQPWWLHCY